MENANMLIYPYCSAELLLWKNIADLNYDPQIIEENTVLSNYLAIYEDMTLFHHFSD